MVLRLGIANIVLSKLILLVIAALPLLDISASQRATYATVLVISMPVLFWSGVALVGRETWRVARHRGLRVVPRELWRLFRHGERARDAALAARLEGARPG
ncbi:MAG: transporter suffix domain-containing protein [Phycisphaeraceae bacterium]